MFDAVIGKVVGGIVALLAVVGLGKEAAAPLSPTETYASDRALVTLLRGIFDGEDAPQETPGTSVKETWDPTAAPARPSPQDMLRAARAMLPVVAPGITTSDTSFRPIEKVKNALENGSLWGDVEWGDVEDEEEADIETFVGEHLNALFFGAVEQEPLDDAWAASTLRLDDTESIDAVEKELDALTESIHFDSEELLQLPEEDLLRGIQSIDTLPIDL